VITEIIRHVAKHYPEIRQYLTGKARYLAAQPFSYKTYEYFLTALERLVSALYNGYIGGEFIDTIANLISGQINDAYIRAWIDEENNLPIPAYLQQAADNDILAQYDYVDQFYKDIVDARVDKTPLAPLLSAAAAYS